MAHHRRSIPRATLYVITAACCFSALGIFTVLGTSTGATLPTVLAGRYGLGALILFAIARSAARIPARRMGALLLAGGIGQALVAFTALSALRFIPVGTMVFLFYTYPAWVAVFAMLRGSERLDARHGLALLLALGGIGFMVGSPWSGALPWQGIALALAGAVLFALYIPLIEVLQRGTTPTVASAYVTGGAGLTFLVVGGAFGAIDFALERQAILAILALAVVCTALAFIFFLRGLATLGPVRTSIISTVEPFSAALIAWLVLGQRVGVPTWAGGALIATAVIVLLTTPKESIPEHIPTP